MSGDAARPLDPGFPNLDPAVVEGYRNAPETMVAEIIDGQLSLMPRPRRRHSHGATRLVGRLSGFSAPGGGDPGGWAILTEPELHIGPRPEALIPGLAGWRNERAAVGFFDESDDLTLAPDWVCEVLSPSTFRVDRKKKLPIYHREGVGHAWLVDPAAQHLDPAQRRQTCPHVGPTGAPTRALGRTPGRPSLTLSLPRRPPPPPRHPQGPTAPSSIQAPPPIALPPLPTTPQPQPDPPASVVGPPRISRTASPDGTSRGPSSATTTAASRTIVCGSDRSISPRRFFQSLGLRPAARTTIRTCPRPG